MLKKIALAFALLLIILAGGVYYAFTNLDRFVIAAVEKYGTAATQTPVKLGHFNLSIGTGEGSLSNLSVGAPQGYAANQSLFLGLVKIDVDTKSLTGTGPIVIKSVVIDKPQITYELNNTGTSNLQNIADNAQNYAANITKSNTQTSAPAAKNPDHAAPSRKIIINDLIISNGQIGITQALLQGKQINAPLPTLHLTNIGKNDGGASPAEIAELLLTTITDSAAKIATANIAKQLNTIAKDAVQKNIDKIGGQLKGFLGQ